MSSRFPRILLLSVMLCFPLLSAEIAAHPLGNFTINRFARIEVGIERVRLRYVVDMAEIPTFQESQLINTDADPALSTAELNAYLEGVIPRYLEGLHLTVDNQALALRLTAKAISLPPGSGGLSTLRIECDFEGDVPASASVNQHRLHFEDSNQRERIGWHEIVVVPASGASVFNSTAFGSAITNELRAYPADMLIAPLDERTAEFSWTQGTGPPGAVALRTRDGRPVEQTARDRFAELIGVKELTPLVALFGLLIAACLGALHAFSPGHGKTVVGAYLVGSRGTARHAAFLGLTVTLTHTSSVFALGLATLFASQYVVPERLYPILSLISGALVLIIGLSLFVQRLRGALGYSTHVHTHQTDAHEHEHEHSHEHHEFHTHEQTDDAPQHEHTHSHDGAASHTHSHGGRAHSHLPPGADGSPVTWRSLLALGISGGLLPCPSALVVLLSAISLHRVGYGLALVVAFSIGLAATLTGIGLLFVYAGRFIKRSIGDHALVRVIPVVSAFVIACVGALICYQSFSQSGMRLSEITGVFFSHIEQTSLTSLGTFAVLGLGLVFGLKHATEVDHVVAVSTIVSQHRHIGRAALVGGLWGIGHTISLIVVGAIVLMLRVAIPERIANWLEFCVALMIIGLGLNALVRALQHKRARLHVHQHTHDGLTHAHIHFHEDGTEHPPAEAVAPHTHAVSRLGFKPLLVGAMHGLAGSATLTLLVLTQIESALLGLLYLTVFGIGSICGMLLMSFLVGLPFALSARRLSGVNYGLQTAAGILSVAFGLWYAYETGIASGLL